MTTLATIHTRLVAICALHSGVVTAQKWYPDDHTGFTATEVPAVCVSPAPNSSNQLLDGGQFVNSQDWVLAWFIKHFPGETKLRDRTTWDLLVPYIQSVPALFNAHRSLEIPGSALGIVSKITLPAVTSLAPATFDGGMFAAIGFRMTTFTIQS
jgi:hypothetical protein